MSKELTDALIQQWANKTVANVNAKNAAKAEAKAKEDALRAAGEAEVAAIHASWKDTWIRLVDAAAAAGHQCRHLTVIGTSRVTGWGHHTGNGSSNRRPYVKGLTWIPSPSSGDAAFACVRLEITNTHTGHGAQTWSLTFSFHTPEYIASVKERMVNFELLLLEELMGGDYIDIEKLITKAFPGYKFEVR